MNDNQTPAQDKVEAPLNLKKFAPGIAGMTDPAAPEDEGQTLFIRRSAAESAAKLPDSAQAQNDEYGLAIKDLLGVITYCYARGVFSSKEIADKLRQEPALRKSFGRHLPDETAIKAFRRLYAAEIEDLLETAYRAFPPENPKISAAQGATETEIVHREAAERMHDAFWEDAMRRHLH